MSPWSSPVFPFFAGLVILWQAATALAAVQPSVPPHPFEFWGVLSPPFPSPPLASDSKGLPLPPLAGAKKSTNRTLGKKPSGTIESGSRMSRKRRFDRGLPRNTRGSLIEAGVIAPEAVDPGVTSGSVSTRAPGVSVRENALPE